MTTPHINSEAVQALHVQHLLTQWDHLLLVRDRHLHWMSETQDPELRARHQEIADLMERAACEYEALIMRLQM